MSVSINTVTLSGTVNKEHREADVGDSHVVETELAFTVPGKDGPKEQWVEIAAWGRLGETLARVPVGGEIIVSGALQRRAWKDKEEKWQSRYSVKIGQIHELGVDGPVSDVPVDTSGLGEDPDPFSSDPPF